MAGILPLKCLESPVFIGFYAEICGDFVRFGARQSMPSSNIDNCAGDRCTAPCFAEGQTNFPCSSRL
jgi:hypothetical protein